MDWPLNPLEGYSENIFFHQEETDYSLQDEDKISHWLKALIKEEKKVFSTINIIFCNDAYLLEKNQEYLDHDTYTDIITFQYEEEPLEGDIFISIERVRENANDLKTTFDQELNRVIAHGVLHLCGYGDKSEEEKIVMRGKEDFYLEQLSK